MKNIVLETKFASTGAKNLNVTSISLGAAGYGRFDRSEYNFALSDAYMARGGNLIDTALVYGTWLDKTDTSYSEIILGEWMEKRGNRDDVVVSTKGAHPIIGTSEKRVNPECIKADIDSSLSHLKTDHIEIYFLHRDDEEKPVSIIMDELNRAAEKGKINLIGASNWTAERMYEANDYCVKNGMRGFDVTQICFNIMRPTVDILGDRTLVAMDDRQLKMYTDMDMPVMSFTSQANAFVERNAFKKDDEIKSRYATPEGIKRLRRIEEIMRKKDMTGTEITIAYLNSQPVTVIPVIGVSSEEHLYDCLDHCDSTLTKEEIDYIDAK